MQVNKGTLIIPKDIQGQINYLHCNIGTTEWAGIILYEVVEGSLDNINEPDFKFTCRVKHLYPRVVGTSGSFSFDFDGEDIVNMTDVIPDALELKQGLVHSHHSMTAHLSGIDIKELSSNSSNFNCYLSLVVSALHLPVAKVVVDTTVEENTECKYKWRDILNVYRVKLERKHTEKKTVTEIDMNVVLEMDDWFVSQVNKIMSSQYKPYSNQHTHSNIPYYGNGCYEDDCYNLYDSEDTYTRTYPSLPCITPAEIKNFLCWWLTDGAIHGADVKDIPTLFQRIARDSALISKMELAFSMKKVLQYYPYTSAFGRATEVATVLEEARKCLVDAKVLNAGRSLKMLCISRIEDLILSVKSKEEPAWTR